MFNCLNYDMTIDDFKDIISLIEEMHCSKINIQEGFTSLYIYNNECELYLKFNNRQIILSRISITKQRKGYCTKIVEILENLCKKYSIKELIVESVITDAMRAFCKKHNFEIEEYSGRYNEGKWYGNFKKVVK